MALCVWNTQHLTYLSHPGMEGGNPYPNSPQRSVESLNWKRCVETFPSCTASVETMRPCMEAAQIGDPFFVDPRHAHCQAYSQCLWGWAFHH